MAPKLVGLLFAARALASFAEMPAINGLAEIDSCRVGDTLVSGCLDSPGFRDAPEKAQAQCLCCVGGINAAPLYGDCASAVKDDRDLTALYSAVSSLSRACVAQPTTICRTTSSSTGPRTSGTGTVVSTTSTRSSSSRSTSTTRPPPACTSFASLISSCSAKDPAFTTQEGEEQASCICYDNGTWDTAFDAYARTCASWAKTANPTYRMPGTLTSFCANIGAVTAASDPTVTPPPVNPTPPPTTGRSSTATVTVPFSTSTIPNAAPSQGFSSVTSVFSFLLSFLFVL